MVVLLAVGLLLCMVGFGLYAWQVNMRGERAVKEVANQLDTRGLLGLYTESLSGNDENGFTAVEAGTSAAYWRAAIALTPEAGDRPLPAVAIVAYTGTEPRQQYHPDVIAAMREAVSESALFYELVDRAKHAKQGPFLPQDAIEEFEANLGLLGDSRQVARWMQVRAALAEAEGDGQAFIDAYTAILAFNDNLQALPNVIDELVRISVDALVREGVAEGLSRLTLSAQQIDVLLAAIEQRRSRYNASTFLGMALSAEYHTVTNRVQSRIRLTEAKQAIVLQNLPAMIESFLSMPDEPGMIERLWDDALLSCAPGRYELRHASEMTRSLEEYDQIVALNGKPGQLWETMTQLAEKRDADEGDISVFDSRGYSANFMTALKTIVRAESRLIAMTAALKVERYRVANGHWPDSLEDAIGEKPRDAYGQALGYRKTNEGIIVYSEGDNRQDEKGYNDREYIGSDQFPDADDFPVMLYNPELRNALPPPEKAIENYDDWSDFELELFGLDEKE